MNGDKNDDISDEVSSIITGIPLSPWVILHKIWSFINPQPEKSKGRVIQLTGVVFFVALAVAGIAVQMMTDLEFGTLRDKRSSSLEHGRIVAFHVYDVALLIGAEMIPAYLYSTGPYDVYLQQSQLAVRDLDSKLIFTENWPTITEFSDIATALRVNITSPNALRIAVRAQRDLRKALNGTDDVQVVNFYAKLIDNLALVSRRITLNSVRYDGWRNFYSVAIIIQVLLNFKKYAVVGSKLIHQNKTVSRVREAVFISLHEYWTRYLHMLAYAVIQAPLGIAVMRNLTEQQVAKEVDELYLQTLRLNFSAMDGDRWNDITSQHTDNIAYALNVVSVEAIRAMLAAAAQWSDVDVISLILISVAGAFSFIGIFAHIIGTVRLQNQIIEYYENLEMLNKTFAILFDYVPPNLVRMAKLQQTPAVHHSLDTCVLISDIANMPFLLDRLDGQEFADLMTNFFERIENCLARYNCFKIDIHGDTIAVANGIGEYHYMDHVFEMLTAALELRDSLMEMNGDLNKEDVRVLSRLGMAIGPCYSRLVYLHVPRMVVVGEVLQAAAILHVSCTPFNLLVSGSVYNRLRTNDQIVFNFRGRLDISNGKGSKIDSYWAGWADENVASDQQDDNSFDHRSVYDEAMDKEVTSNMRSRKLHK